MSVPVTIRLPEDIVKWLKKQKKSTGVPIQKIIATALEEYRNCNASSHKNKTQEGSR